MAIKIRVSYEHDKDLEKIKDLLKVKDAKIKTTSKPGQYKKAYIVIKDIGV